MVSRYLSKALILFLCGLLIIGLSQQNLAAEIHVESVVEPSNPVLQQQVLYTLRVYRESHLLRGYFLTPEIPQAVLRLKQNLPARSVQYKGQTYELLEQQYYLYPQASGDIELPPPVFSSQELYVKGKPIILRVQGPKYSEKPWLIASRLSLKESQKDTLNPLQVGSIVIREVQIQADNTLSMFLPELIIPEQEGLIVQKLPAKLADSNQDSIRASRIERFRLVFQRAGAYTLPAISIQWWDRQQKKIQISRLPSQTFHVAPGVSQSKVLTQTPSTPTVLQKNRRDKSEDWQNIMVYGGAILIALILMIWGWHQRYHASVSQTIVSQTIVWQKMHRIYYRINLQKKLFKALRKKDYKTLRTLLLQAKQKAYLEDSDGLKKLFHVLNHILYAPPQSVDNASVEQIPQLINVCLKELTQKHIFANWRTKEPVLKPLWGKREE